MTQGLALWDMKIIRHETTNTLTMHSGTKSKKPGQKSKNETQILLFWVIVLIIRYHTLIVSERIFFGIISFCDRRKLKHGGQLSLSGKYVF